MTWEDDVKKNEDATQINPIQLFLGDDKIQRPNSRDLLEDIASSDLSDFDAAKFENIANEFVVSC